MRTLLALVAAAFLSVTALPVHADPFTSVVVYGDSLSDNGNVFAATGGNFPPFPYYSGRFSNGPVAVEQLAGLLNVPIYDYAFGGATSGTGNVLSGPPYFLSGLPGISGEISNYVLPASQYASALTVVWGGANDFEALAGASDAETIAAAVQAADNIRDHVNTLKGEGAVTILVPDLPDLGKVPRYAGNGQSAQATLYTNTFNAELKSDLSAGVILFDTNAVFNTILADTTDFKQGIAPCIPAGLLSGCSGYLFFDDLHPTTAADAILARDFAAAVVPTPEPSSLVLLGTGLASAAAMLRRLRAAGGRQDYAADQVQ